jgi:hypothetical protein
MNKPVQLMRRHDQVCVCRDGETEPVPVKVVWMRPVSGVGQEVALLDEKKREVAMLRSLDELDTGSRAIAEEELQRRYLMAKIHRVINAWAQLGTRYLHVETDRGVRQFVIKNPNRDLIWLSSDHIVIRDTLGNRYEIASLAGLDAASRARLESVI